MKNPYSKTLSALSPKIPYRKTCPACKKAKLALSFRFARPAQLRETCNACYLSWLASDPTGKRVQTAEVRGMVSPAKAFAIRQTLAARKAEARSKESARKSEQMTEYHAARRSAAPGVKE
jgi:hypothetical protein